MRGSTSQWSFSNMASQLVSFKSAQELGGSHRSYPPHFPQRTLALDKQGGSQYPITSHHWHQNDLPPINHPSEGRVFNGTSPSQSMYMPGKASNLMTSTMGGASVSPANGPVVGSTDLRSSPSISTGPCQLTIFYNGSVCVYDHVSPEKAQAIMLLAGNGESTKPSAAPIAMSSTPKVQPSVSKLPSTDPPIVTQPLVSRLSVINTAATNKPPVLKLPANGTLTANHGPTLGLHSNDTTIVNEPLSTRLVVKDSSASNQAGRSESPIASSGPITQSPVVASTSGSEVNSVKPVAVSIQAKCLEPSQAGASVGAGGVNKSTPSAVPQARKASLARFLEKRKERVIDVSPYPVSKNSSECNTIGFGSTFATNFVSSKKQLDTVESRT